MNKQTKTGSDPKTQNPLGIPAEGLGGENARGEPAGCPTGLAESDQAQSAQQPGGGGAPGTGAADPSASPSPGEGVTEKQVEASGLDGAGE